MRMPTALRNLDDRVLGRSRSKADDRPGESAGADGSATSATRPGDRTDRVETTRTERRPDKPAETSTKAGAPGTTGKGAQQALGVVWRISQLVFLLLALVVILGIVFTFTPTNDDNVIVRNALSLADGAAGPFRDVFTADDPDRMLLYNYALATGVYLLAASLVTKLPGGAKS